MAELIEKLASDPHFRRQMEEQQYKHQMILQRAIYSDLSSIKPSLLVDAGRTLSNDHLFLFFGSETPQLTKSSIEKVFMYLVKWLEQQMERGLQGFVMVYFHTACNSYSCYLTFRKIFRSLPLKYYERLRNIIIMNPSFTVRAMEWFVSGTLNKYLSNLTKIAYSFGDLRRYNIVVSFADHIYFPRVVWEQLNSGIEGSKKSSNKSFKSKSSSKPGATTGGLLPKTETGFNLEDYQTNQLGIPLVVELMIAYFLMKPERLKEEGLFRKSVSVDDINQATGQLQKKNYEYLNQITNPHVVGNLIKRFLSQLKDPIMPYQVYDQLVHDGGRGNQISYLRAVMQQLPLKNYTTIVFILNFFINEVVPLADYNKMTFYNVAVVLSPCLMRSSKNAIEDLIYSKKTVLILEFILEHFEEIFGTKEQKEELFRQSAKIQQDKFYRQSLGADIQNLKFEHKQPLMQPPRLQNLGAEEFRFSSQIQDNQSLVKKPTTHQVGMENHIFPFWH